MRKMQVTSFANAMEYMKKKNGGAGGFEQFFTFQIYPLDRHGLRKQLRSWVQIPPGPSFIILVNYCINRAHFHSHAMVVTFPLLSSILSLYTATVLFREATSPVVELVLKKIIPWSNTMPVAVSLCPRASKIIVAFSPASVVMVIVPF